MSQLLTTKFYIPPLRPEHVARARLTTLFSAFPHRRLTLIAAPAGFGKTSLVSEWVASLQSAAHDKPAQAPTVVWLSLDEDDNDLSRFLTYLIAALNQAERIGQDSAGALREMLHTPQPGAVDDVLITLLNAIAAGPERTILILDDYHAIHTPAIDQALSYLLEHLPPQLHLVIATRDDPQLPLARLRARGQMTELRAADLRFTVAETATFLNQAMGLDLSAEDIAALEARTEGWAVGLQLAALALRSTASAQDDATIPDRITAFSGSHRFILDYLIEEVLERQPDDVQTFLLQTAILNRLSASLCDAVTEQHDGQTILTRLEQANLFIISLDHHRAWYRYHHLFADLLRQRLQQTRAAEAPTLHRRASAWYEQSGIMDEAIEHALQAQDFARAAELIAGIAEDVWGRDEYSRLRRWLDRLPAELVHTRPQLAVLYAWSLIATGHLQDAESTLQAADHALSAHTSGTSPPDQPDDREAERSIRGRIAVTRAYLGFFQNRVPAIVQYAHAALGDLPNEASIWWSTAIIALGDALSLQGEYAAAYQKRVDAVAVCQATSKTHMVMVANLKLAVTARHCGRLAQTMAICQDQLRLAQARGMAATATAGCLLAVWGEVLAEMDDLDAALPKAQDGVALTERGGDVLMRGWGYICLARVYFSRGNLAAIDAVIQRLEGLNRERDVPAWLMHQVRTWRVRVWLAQGDLASARQWLDDHGLDAQGQPRLQHELAVLVYARILLAEGSFDAAIDLLHGMLAGAEAGGRTSSMVEIQILMALTYQARGDHDAAMLAIAHALRLAAPCGFVRIFLDEGPAMAQLLAVALARGIAAAYVRRLVAAFPSAAATQSAQTHRPSDPSAWVEPLSDREHEVLTLIAQGLTNPDIATRLFLSPHTIKVHTRNIFEKLGVHNRTQAVARGRALGLLASE